MLLKVLPRVLKVYSKNFLGIFAVSIAFSLLSYATSIRSSPILSILTVLVTAPFQVSIINYFLCAYRNGKAQFKDLFRFFSSWRLFFSSILVCLFLHGSMLVMFILFPTGVILLVGAFLYPCLDFAIYLFCYDTDVIPFYSYLGLALHYMIGNLLKLILFHVIALGVPGFGLLFCASFFLFNAYVPMALALPFTLVLVILFVGYADLARAGLYCEITPVDFLAPNAKEIARLEQAEIAAKKAATVDNPT
ncbi:MAG: hypothetical protein RSA20_06355 [Oscillospiraceae bacterium]